MPITISPVTPNPEPINAKVAEWNAVAAASGAYSTGGWPTPSSFKIGSKFKTVFSGSIGMRDGFNFEYDGANDKIKCYEGGGLEVANGATITVSNILLSVRGYIYS